MHKPGGNLKRTETELHSERKIACSYQSNKKQRNKETEDSFQMEGGGRDGTASSDAPSRMGPRVGPGMGPQMGPRMGPRLRARTVRAAGEVTWLQRMRWLRFPTVDSAG